MALDLAPLMVSIIIQIFILYAIEHNMKNWMTINTVRDAQASAIIYSVTKTASANNFNVYYYISYLLTEQPKIAEKDGNIEKSKLEPLMPSSKTLLSDCYKVIIHGQFQVK